MFFYQLLQPQNDAPSSMLESSSQGTSIPPHDTAVFLRRPVLVYILGVAELSALTDHVHTAPSSPLHLGAVKVGIAKFGHPPLNVLTGECEVTGSWPHAVMPSVVDDPFFLPKGVAPPNLWRWGFSVSASVIGTPSGAVTGESRPHVSGWRFRGRPGRLFGGNSAGRFVPALFDWEDSHLLACSSAETGLKKLVMVAMIASVKTL